MAFVVLTVHFARFLVDQTLFARDMDAGRAKAKDVSLETLGLPGLPLRTFFESPTSSPQRGRQHVARGASPGTQGAAPHFEPPEGATAHRPGREPRAPQSRMYRSSNSISCFWSISISSSLNDRRAWCFSWVRMYLWTEAI